MSKKNIRHDGYTTGIDGDLYTGMNDRNDVPIYEGDKIWELSGDDKYDE